MERLATRPDVRDTSFRSTHAGAELDLRLGLGGRVAGVEIERTDSPTTSKSIHSAPESLELDHLVVVHGGEHRFPMAASITAVPARDVLVADEATAALVPA